MDVIELSSKKKKSLTTTSVKKGRKKKDVEETINVEEVIKSVDELLENEGDHKNIVEDEIVQQEVVEEEEVMEEEEVVEQEEEEEVVEDDVKEEQVVKKKRGRKPKGEKKVEEEESIVDENSEVVHKKRGRKPKPKEKVYNIKELSTFETFEEEKSETLILHLPIKSSDIYNSAHPSGFNYEKRPVATYSLDGSVQKSEPQKITENTTYNDILKNNIVEKKDFKVIFEDQNVEKDDKNIVDEYDKKVKEFKEFKLTNFIKLVPNSNSLVKKEQVDEDVSNAVYHGTSLKELDEQTTQNVFKPNPFMESSHLEEDIIQEHTNKMNKKNLKNIMVEFINANMYHEWPDQTNIHCWWCCHQFDGPPCCLPDYIRRDKFYVSGCFCSFNCAASYNFSKNDNSVWERYTLLNLMYKKLYNTNFVKISMAPPREVLKMFGGYLSIDEFRDHCIKQDRVFQVVKPPLISIIPKIEENLNPKNRAAVNENILQSTQTKLKLTRTKPLIGEKSTIQAFMNITPKERE
jgi:hypothetical protein